MKHTIKYKTTLQGCSKMKKGSFIALAFGVRARLRRFGLSDQWLHALALSRLVSDGPIQSGAAAHALQNPAEIRSLRENSDPIEHFRAALSTLPSAGAYHDVRAITGHQ